MYVITILNEDNEPVQRIELKGETMTTVERELTEQLYNLIEGYTLSITLEA